VSSRQLHCTGPCSHTHTETSNMKRPLLLLLLLLLIVGVAVGRLSARHHDDDDHDDHDDDHGDDHGHDDHGDDEHHDDHHDDDDDDDDNDHGHDDEFEQLDRRLDRLTARIEHIHDRIQHRVDPARISHARSTIARVQKIEGTYTYVVPLYIHPSHSLTRSLGGTLVSLTDVELWRYICTCHETYDPPCMHSLTPPCTATDASYPSVLGFVRPHWLFCLCHLDPPPSPSAWICSRLIYHWNMLWGCKDVTQWLRQVQLMLPEYNTLSLLFCCPVLRFFN